MLKGTVVLPSLNRPHLLKEFFKCYKDTDSTIPGLLLIDDQDFKKNEAAYQDLELPKEWRIVRTTGVTMAAKINEVWDQIITLDYVCILNDDHKPKTNKWDAKIAGLITGSNIVATNDGWKAPHRLCGAITYSGNVLRAVGYMFPPGVQHLYHDDAWEFLGNKAGCVQIAMDIMVEHDHVYKHGKVDETFKKVNSEESWKGDIEAFEAWHKSGEAERAAERLVGIQPKQGIMLATPSHDGNVCFQYALGLSDTNVACAMNRIHFEIGRVEGSSLLSHTRNCLVDMFLKSKCQKLLFVDADQGFTAQSVLTLLQSNKRIIAGITPHKRFPINLNFEPLPDDCKYFKEFVNKSVPEFIEFAKVKADPKGEIEVARAGTGFIMIDRSVFDIMKDHVDTYSPFENNPSVKHHEYFKSHGHEGKFRGEDWMFTELAKKLKIPTYISANVMVSHKGSYTW